MKKLDAEIMFQLSQSLEMNLPVKKSLGELKLILSRHINYLIDNDFEKLVQILYRVDVPEKILKEHLQDQKTDTGAIIAGLILERELQKVKTREKFKSNDNIAADDKW